MSNGIYVVDVESTGVTNHPVHGHPQIIEFASIELQGCLLSLSNQLRICIKETSLKEAVENFIMLGTSSRYMPSMQIHKRAVEVHGITMKTLLGLPKSESIEFPDIEYLVGHNIQYDYRCMGKPKGMKLICTLKLARQIDKKFGVGFKNHKQDDLLLHFYGEDIRWLVTGHHAALEDCVKCILLLVKLLEYVPNVKTVEELYNFQQLLSKK